MSRFMQVREEEEEEEVDYGGAESAQGVQEEEMAHPVT